MKVTVIKNRTQYYEAILWYAYQKNPKLVEAKMILFGESKVSFVINEPITINDVLITPVTKGGPNASFDYGSEPKIYQELVLESSSEETIKSFIEEAKIEYDKKSREFEKFEKELLVFTWDGGCWCDEYKTPKRSNKSIYLPDDSYQKIIQDLKTFYENGERYKELDIPHTRTYMFHGIPGTGKTSTIYTIATELNKNIAIIDFSDKDVCDSCIRRALYKLPSDTVLCLEDIDSLFSQDRKSDKSTITFSGVLNILDGVIKNTGLVIFMTTNLLKNLDDAAMKRRVDYYLKFDVMKREQIINMFTRFYPHQDSEKFVERVSKLKLTPCILQKFFTRHLMSLEIIDHIQELETMCKCDYNLSENNSMYM
jgi:SpoVK/Ycf46/Vps4 family AAA+-type ATPase